MLVAELKVAPRVFPKLLPWTVKLKFKSRDPRPAVSFYDAPSVCVVLVAEWMLERRLDPGASVGFFRGRSRASVDPLRQSMKSLAANKSPGAITPGPINFETLRA